LENQVNNPTQSERMLLRREEVEEMTGLSRSTIYREIKADRFPKPVRTAVRAVSWRRTDIENWISSLQVAG